MPRGANTQTRDFVYDSTTQRLSSATNPENGTVSYTYNADGTLASKTDGKNQTETYTYDPYGRLTGIPQRQQSFTYDTCPPGDPFCTSTPGQLPTRTTSSVKPLEVEGGTTQSRADQEPGPSMPVSVRTTTRPAPPSRRSAVSTGEFSPKGSLRA